VIEDEHGEEECAAHVPNFGEGYPRVEADVVSCAFEVASGAEAWSTGRA
jgi:hypothetical protein